MLRTSIMAKFFFVCVYFSCFSMFSVVHAATWKKKTAIPTVVGTSCITTTPGGGVVIVGTYDKGIFVSQNGGISWLQTLSFAADSTIYCIKHVGGSKVIAGAAGRVYVSDDDGMSWRNASISINYSVRDIIAVSNRLYVCTGDYVSGVPYGDGVLVSVNGGNSWTRVNTGLPLYESVWNLAADRAGRIFVTCVDASTGSSSGLYYTVNGGGIWNNIPMTVNGQGVILDGISVTQAFDLAISPNDSIICSGDAISSSVYVSGIFKNTFGSASGYWNFSGLNHSPSFWQRTPTYALYFIDSNRVLGSYSGGTVTGGPYYSTDKGNTWERRVDGVDVVGVGYNANEYVAGPGDRVYMIQHGDDDLYYADSLNAPPVIAGTMSVTPGLRIYPNPSQNILYVACEAGCQIDDISIVGIDGRNRMCAVTKSSNLVTLHYDLPAGWYFLHYITNNGKPGTLKFEVE